MKLGFAIFLSSVTIVTSALTIEVKASPEEPIVYEPSGESFYFDNDSTSLKNSLLLEEIVVKGEKSQMTVASDRRVFNVNSNVSSVGANAEELLAKVPSVQVGTDGDISLRGNSNVLVLINGKEMGMNADNRSQMLRQIPAETIEAIEVLSNPSAKHSTEGTAGIINIRLRENHRHGTFGSIEADVDLRGGEGLNLNVNHNEGRFDSFAALGIKSKVAPGGTTSFRNYTDGSLLDSHERNTLRENSMFLRLGTTYSPSENDRLYVSAVGTIGNKHGHLNAEHLSTIPGQWNRLENSVAQWGDNIGANVLTGYKHIFGRSHELEANLSYNIWKGKNESRSLENEYFETTANETSWLSQHQDVKISNWEAELNYEVPLAEWLILQAGYKGNYNHENSPASYYTGLTRQDLQLRQDLYNRFIYDTDITALYFNFTGEKEAFSYSLGLRGESWQTRTRSLDFSGASISGERYKRNDFELFPSLSASWKLPRNNILGLSYSRRITRPFGPQLNTFENIADPAETHLGNPEIQPEFSNAAELAWHKNWDNHLLVATTYFRSNNDMISHISFLGPMPSGEPGQTMYYGHANVGNMINVGVELMARNKIADILTLTTLVNLYNNHLKAWETEYPMRAMIYPVAGSRQNRFVWEARIMASIALPWEMTFQASGRYNSRRIAPQGTVESDWDVEAGLRKTAGKWTIGLVCKDIFKSKTSHNILYGNGYSQSIAKWSEGRILRLSVAYTFGGAHKHDHDSHDHELHNDVDTGGYGQQQHHHH